jgi:hypothetical protein
MTSVHGSGLHCSWRGGFGGACTLPHLKCDDSVGKNSLILKALSESSGSTTLERQRAVTMQRKGDFSCVGVNGAAT